MITFDEIIRWIGHFAQTDTQLAVLSLVLILALTYFMPKMMFKVYAFLAFVAVVIYLLSLFGGALQTGSLQKETLGTKTLKAVD